MYFFLFLKYTHINGYLNVKKNLPIFERLLGIKHTNNRLSKQLFLQVPNGKIIFPNLIIVEFFIRYVNDPGFVLHFQNNFLLLVKLFLPKISPSLCKEVYLQRQNICIVIPDLIVISFIISSQFFPTFENGLHVKLNLHLRQITWSTEKATLT